MVKNNSSAKNSLDVIILFFGVNLTILSISLLFFDPFNIPKFFSVLLIGLFSLKVILTNFGRFTRLDLTIASLTFLIIAFFTINVILNTSKWSAIIGVYGRNTGVLAYVSMLLLFLATSSIQLIDYRKALFFLTPAAFLLALYGLIQNSGSDPINWSNPYSPIIGTFGNPNFMSAYMGWASMLFLVVLSVEKITLGWKLTFVTSITAFIYLILKSNSIQGLFVIAIGTGLLLTLQGWNLRFVRYVLLPLYLVAITAGLLGTLNKGPVAQLVYQNSIAARGDYWRAALRMISDYPLLGVGIDRFGEFFPFYRDIEQAQNRNWATYTDNAHNVFLHLAATAGIIVAISWLGLHLVIWTKSLSVIVRSNNSESKKILTGLLTLSISAFLPAIISVDNIAASALSWFQLGLLYSWLRHSEKSSIKKISSSRFRVINVSIIVLLAVTVYEILYPIYVAESTLVHYVKTRPSYSSVFQKEKVFAKVLHEVPDEYRYLTLIGGEYARDGEFARAREMYLKALQKYPQKAELYRLIALTYEGQNDLENAVRSREMTRMYDRFNMGNLLQLVDDLVQLNRLEEATRYYQEMTEILPEYPYTLEAAELIKGKRS